MFFRPGTTDVINVRQIFARRCFDCYLPDLERPTIVDAGANAGYTSLFYLRRYPDARLIAIEPDAANLGMMRCNLAAFAERVTILEGALWPREEKLSLYPSSREDGHFVRPGIDGTMVKAVTPDRLVEHFGGRIDIFKCDIEGAEEALFADPNRTWIECVGALIVEIHGDHLRPRIDEAIGPAFRRNLYREFDVFVRDVC